MKLLVEVNEATYSRIKETKSIPDMFGTDIVNGLNAIKYGEPYDKSYSYTQDDVQGSYKKGLDDGYALAVKKFAKTQGEKIKEIPIDFLYDTETSEFYCYRNKYTGEEIHITKDPKTYTLVRPQGEWIDHTATQNLLWGQYECPFCHKRSNRGAHFCQYCGAEMRNTEGGTD